MISRRLPSDRTAAWDWWRRALAGERVGLVDKDRRTPGDRDEASLDARSGAQPNAESENV